LPDRANRPLSNHEDVFSAPVRPSAFAPEKNNLSLGTFDAPQGVTAVPSHTPQPAQMGAFERNAPEQVSSFSLLKITGGSFGEDKSAPKEAPPAGRRIVLESRFDAAEPPAEHPKTTWMSQPAITPVEILSKPKPVYTAEARLSGVQGSVILDVLFTASGRVDVLRVVRGLGHGLDDAAIDAARKILFRPATAAGKPVDYRATVRIIFQLAF
jgi:TonB family protein